MQLLTGTSLPLNWTLVTFQRAVQVCCSWMTPPYKCGSLLTAPPTLPTRLTERAAFCTSWDCRLAQSTPSKMYYLIYLEQRGSLPSLSGCPSTPQVALTPTAGGLTVQLTVMYPGTREDTLQYSISMSPSPLSRRQTGQQPFPVTDLTTPISGSAEVALGPGTYSVTVTVTNQQASNY